MSTPTLIMWVIVFAVGVPSAWKNPTAAALVLAKFFGFAIAKMTGNNLPVQYYLFPDLFVLAVIFAKQQHVCLFPYRNRWEQFKCMILERSPADRAIIAIFFIMWLLYVADIHDYYKWWALYYLVVAQFLLAGLESFFIFRRAHTAASDTPETTTDDECRYAWSRGYG